MLKKVGLTVLLMAASGAVLAHGSGSEVCQYFTWGPISIPYDCHWVSGNGAVVAPELDTGSAAVGGIVLALGGLAVLRGRRHMTTKTKA